MKDGWYWYDGIVWLRHYKKNPKGASLIRLWTGTTGRQQAYLNGKDRLRPYSRDMVRKSGKLVHAAPPSNMTLSGYHW